MQMGEYILREGEELSSTSKFYLVQSGVVECFKQFNVGTASCFHQVCGTEYHWLHSLCMSCWQRLICIASQLMLSVATMACMLPD